MKRRNLVIAGIAVVGVFVLYSILRKRNKRVVREGTIEYEIEDD